MSEINFYNVDCMEFMKNVPDKYYDLAIVDPPYGIDVNKMNLGSGKYKTSKKWDEYAPNKEYFDNLFRVSKHQIVWGANYMTHFLPPSMGWIFWDKNNGTSDFSDGELAFSSFNRALRKFTFNLTQQNKVDIKTRFHPTQKPVQLYRWLLQNYAKQGDKILDTHGGSMSIAIACHEEKFDLDICEIDKEYFDSGLKRYEWHIKQLKLF